MEGKQSVKKPVKTNKKSVDAQAVVAAVDTSPKCIAQVGKTGVVCDCKISKKDVASGFTKYCGKHKKFRNA